MDKQEFLAYIDDNFSLDGAAKRLIANILNYAESLPCSEHYTFLTQMLDGTIGLSDSEIRRIEL